MDDHFCKWVFRRFQLFLILLVWSVFNSGTLFAKTYNVKQFGVRGDGKTSDSEKIQELMDKACQDGGGVLFFPAVKIEQGEYYKITTELKMRDLVVLEGEGPASLLKKPDAPGKTPSSGNLFKWGTAFPHEWARAKAWPIQEVNAGAMEIRLKNPSQISDFSVGNLIRISDPRIRVYRNRMAHEWYGQLVRVMEIKPEGILLVSDPVRFRFAPLPGVGDPRLHKIENTRAKGEGFGSWRAGMRNLALESAGRVTQQGGAVQCFMENLSVKGYSGVFYGNCWNHCWFKNIHEKVAQGMEFSDCSVGNVIENLHQEYVRPERWSLPSWWADIHEGSSFNTISNFTYFVGNQEWKAGIIKPSVGMSNTWMHGVIDASQIPKGKSILLQPGAYFYAFNIGNVLSDIHLKCNQPEKYLSGKGSDSSYGHRIEKLTIEDVGGGSTIEWGSESSYFSDITLPSTAKFILTGSSSNNTVVLGAKLKAGQVHNQGVDNHILNSNH